MPRKKPTSVEATATLHEQTVKNAELHATQAAPTPAPSAPRRNGKPANGPVSAITVNPQAMQIARELMRPGQRVRIVSASTVILENVPD